MPVQLCIPFTVMVLRKEPKGGGDGRMAKRDYYDVLGIDRNADEKEIKRAYRKLAKKYHPDTNSGDRQAEQKFKEVTEAYNILSDAEKRKLYDRYGFAAFEEGGGPYQNGNGGYYSGGTYQNGSGGYYSSGGFGNGGTWQEFHFDGDADGMEDIFEDIFGGMFRGGNSGSRAYSGQGGGSRAYSGQGGGSWGYSGQNGGSRAYSRNGFSGRSYQQKGADAHADINVSFEEAALGCDKVFSLRGNDGQVQSIQVHVPAGIDEGKRIRLKGRGGAGINGGAAGDLLLKVHIMPKAGFERKGMDVYVTANIPYTTAVFGGEAIVPTIDGRVSCRIPAGTQSGSRIRLRNKGIVSMNDSSKKGDEYVVIQIQVPQHLTPAERQKLKEYEQICQNTNTTQSDGRFTREAG